MKILYLHQYFNTLEMAGGTRSFEMARRLAEKGHEVHVVTSMRERDVRNLGQWMVTLESGINVHWFPVPYDNTMPYNQRLKAFFLFAYAAARMSASLEADVIFATSTPLTIAIPAVYASKRQRIPMVFEVRDLWPAGPIAVGALKNPLAIIAARRLELFAYRNSKHIIALSPGMKDGILSTGYPEEQVTVIPNLCDTELFNASQDDAFVLRRRYDWLQDRPLIIYAGALGLINGVDYMVRLAAEMQRLEPEVRFVILGEGREAGKIQALASELGVLNRNLFMMGCVPKAQMPSWLAAADIATSFCIDIEIVAINSANKFFDALAAGRAVAINYGGWQADIIKERGVGLVLDVNDVRASSMMLARSVVDKEWISAAGVAARKVAEERFDRNKLAAFLESVLLKAIEEG